MIYTYTTLGNSATGGVDEGNIYVRTVGKDKRTKSRSSSLRQRCATRRSGLSGATISVFTSDFSGGFKSIQLQLRGQDVGALAQAADMVKAEVEKRSGRRRHRSFDEGAEARARNRTQSRRRRLDGTDGGTGRAIVASGIRGHRCGLLDRSDGQVTQGDGASDAGIAVACVGSGGPPDDRDRTDRCAVDDAARSGGDDQRGARPGDHRSSQSRSGRDGRVEHLRPRRW